MDQSDEASPQLRNTIPSHPSILHLRSRRNQSSPASGLTGPESRIASQDSRRSCSSGRHAHDCSRSRIAGHSDTRTARFCCISPGQHYAFRGSTGVPRQCLRAPNWLEQRYNGPGKYVRQMPYAAGPARVEATMVVSEVSLVNRMVMVLDVIWRDG